MRLKLSQFDKLAFTAWAILASCAAAMGAGLLSMPILEKVPLCFFKFLTGLPCPGCGMGHALLLAFQGQWADSFRQHPLGIPFLAVWTLWILVRLLKSPGNALTAQVSQP
ncbi:MAG: hypothetical protein A3J74_05910 [Elusimicrobia bacterium RIFCSPHIGHO2_02_FULL_57_9]|nr:MAG: hypothetical protein A3J74_05910 [Elusimicrobia bacterium RIFCSPHIGHO2_02_FULL_57_9]